MFDPPYPPYDPTDESGFSYETVVKRWPIILTGIIDHLYSVNHELALAVQNNQESPQGESIKLDELTEEKIEEGKAIIEKLSGLKYHMGRDHTLDPIPDDGEAHVDTYNTELARLRKEGKDTWFTAPWLFAECYLYRLIRSYFAQTRYWQAHDPFFAQKQETFRKSGDAIYQLATTMQGFEAEKDLLESDPDKLNVLFQEMIQMCLWGNATDLSLLTNLSHADIQKLQSIGKDAQNARKEYILRDDQEAVWDHIKTQLNGGRVDFVLDNAGFEVVTDFIFADFLVTYTPYVSRVVFHPKLIPWFVSDVTPPDFASTVSSLLDPSFFPPPSSSLTSSSPSSTPTESAEEMKASLERMVTRWRTYLADGTFALSVPPSTELGAKDPRADFWTAPWPYWDMETRAGELWRVLKEESGLVIFKGDLNYRKLTGDIGWPASTPFATALGPLAGSFPILSLRTNKADVVVGVDHDVAEKLDASGEKWRVSGRYALVSFLQGEDVSRL